MVTQVSSVVVHGVDIGVIAFDTEAGTGIFEYTQAAIRQGYEYSPIRMPLGKTIYSFPELPFETFKGLPGLVADSLPDDFGNAVLDAWLAGQGRTPNSVSPVERLQYIGSRGMGALEFSPPKQWNKRDDSRHIDVQQLVEIAQGVLDQRAGFEVTLSKGEAQDTQSMMALLSVGTSAGGARPKAVLAFNENFSVVRSGQVDAPEGFTHYLMKFDGVSERKTGAETFGDPIGYGAMEYVYSLIAKESGIDMMPCRLLAEGPRRHFITQRFDRVGNSRIHTQTLNALDHQNYKAPGTYSYEQILATARKLKLNPKQAEQLVRRAAFNIIMRNHDDHPKNFSFQMRDGVWSLAPAYDLAYSYKPQSKWVDVHWMSLNGKRDHFNRDDFYALVKVSPLFDRKFVDGILDQVLSAAAKWESLALEHAVPKGLVDQISKTLRRSEFKKSTIGKITKKQTPP